MYSSAVEELGILRTVKLTTSDFICQELEETIICLSDVPVFRSLSVPLTFLSYPLLYWRGDPGFLTGDN